MKTMNQMAAMEEKKALKTLEEAELQVVVFTEDDMIVTSGCPYECQECSCNGGGCLSTGTKITMADGSVKNIEAICEGDLILSFDHEAGRLTGNPVLYAYKGEEAKCAFTLHFANEAMLSIVDEHDLFEQESMKYVTIRKANAEQFIGKHFYSVDDQSYVELIEVNDEKEARDYYEIYTAKTLNCIANGFLNVADDVDHLLNIYEFDEDLKADPKVLAEDLRLYGWHEFSEKYGFTEEESLAWRMPYLNMAVGKGLISWDELWTQHMEYLNQRDDRGCAECA